MKKNDIFTFTAPNGVEVTAVALYAVTLFIGNIFICYKWVCYAQNRLFTIMVYREGIKEHGEFVYDKVIVDHAILPEYDELLARYNDLEVAQAETANGM